MKLKQLEIALQDIEVFETPKVHLEQYPTTPHLAACVLYDAQARYGDIEGMSVADLGCGTGMLAIGAAILGAGHVCGFDVDPDALEIARGNVTEFEVDVDLVHVDLCHFCSEKPPGGTMAKESQAGGGDEGDAQGELTSSADDGECWGGKRSFDTVVMNPPFGTKCKGIDVLFLQRALGMASRAVYSMHKSSTRDHLAKKAAQWGVTFTVMAQLMFDLPATYAFHKRDNVVVEVDLIRLGIPESGLKLGVARALWITNLEWEGGNTGEDREEAGERIGRGRGGGGRGKGGGRGGRGGGRGGGRR